MSAIDLAIPILPCRSILDTVNFYKRLGFEGGPHGFNSDYAIMTRQGVEIHFFKHASLRPCDSFSGCYIRVAEVDHFYSACLRLGLPSAGIPRLDKLEDKAWGLREFAIVDADGNLIRVGQILAV
ncbi:MAG: VOC family protein [Hydrogenophaga sp.]|jgi:catechol 2,3-dioxygenase-like lactoylglutathione lyase family enzyme|uniref:bleomycin resistance protein n=1 Tax=Limnohabitans sp. Bal53 TaxID=1977910 RepID=UPI000D3471E4|nr:VOC family protein [Limnohabitans sp. Bal53]MDP4621692.1 VOC family protein [Hydrogenophaga sp.]PUE38491.1 glyoxalase/bleomycin resistance/extradiol dioxygenase family protein [Limnohabitans sp. Bal53]